MATILMVLLVMPARLRAQADEPRALVETAAELMGGEETLRAADRVRFAMMTQWQRADFGPVPFRDRPSYEVHYDVRDYSIPAWRNTRDFGARQIRNVIRDSIAVTDMGEGFGPLSIAYVDERDELFTYTPDRLVLALLDAPRLKARGDTIIGRERHVRVSATLHGRYPATVYLHRGTGLPTLLRFRAGHFADFGLVPWGEMDVDVWYSGWRTFGEISIPTQWDIWREGARYKRMTVRAADFAPDFVPADSFAVSPELRDAYLTSNAVLPMHEGRPVPEPVARAGAVELGSFGMPAAALDVGEGWLLLGAGQAPFNFEQTMELIRPHGVQRLVGVVSAEGRISNGGVVRAAELGVPIYASIASEPFVERMLAEVSGGTPGFVTVTEPVTVGDGSGRVVLAPVDLPDVPGALMVFRPASGWLYVPDASTPLDERVARTRAEALGWAVRVVGTPRASGLEEASGTM